MVDLGLLQSVSYIAGALGVCVAAAYYVLTLRTTQRNVQTTLETRHTQILLQLMDNLKKDQPIWTKFMFTYKWSNLEDYLKKYGPEGNPEAWDEQLRLCINFEGLGIIISKGLIDVSIVYEMYGDWVLRYWEKWTPIVLELRRTYGPEFFEWFEYLVGELKKYRLVKYGPDPARVHPELKI